MLSRRLAEPVDGTTTRFRLSYSAREIEQAATAADQAAQALASLNGSVHGRAYDVRAAAAADAQAYADWTAAHAVSADNLGTAGVHPGQIYRVDDAYVHVVRVDPNWLLVERAYLGSERAEHAAEAELVRMFLVQTAEAGPEGPAGPE